MAIDKAVDSTVLDGYFEDIADAIREKDGTQNTYTPAQMPTAIENIPSGSSYDWQSLGFSGEPAFIQEAYDYAVEIKQNNKSYFKGDKKLYIMPSINLQQNTSMYDSFNDTPLSAIALFDTSNIKTFNRTFYGTPIKTIPLFNISNATQFQSTFQACANLTSIPALNTSNALNMYRMFHGCTSLRDIPVLDTSKINSTTGLQQTFQACNSLTDTSLDNILQMCINATSYGGTKTLAYIGLNSTAHPASRIQALPHYQDFIDAGWEIGY